MAAFQKKSWIENKNSINIENLWLTQYFRNLQSEKLVSGLLPVQSVGQ